MAPNRKPAHKKKASHKKTTPKPHPHAIPKTKTTPKPNATPKPRPSNILQVDNPITLANANNSPLLRLPGELMNKILSYVYPKNKYMIDTLQYEPKKWNYKLKRMVLQQVIARRHGCCGSKGQSSKVDNDMKPVDDILPVLHLVCRQLHDLTATLPYKRYVFTFARAEDMPLWVLCRSKAQLEAIEEVRPTRAWFEDVFSGVRDNFSKTFKNVGRVVVPAKDWVRLIVEDLREREPGVEFIMETHYICDRGTRHIGGGWH